MAGICLEVEGRSIRSVYVVVMSTKSEGGSGMMCDELRYSQGRLARSDGLNTLTRLFMTMMKL
jgi:hypothetical protein